MRKLLLHGVMRMPEPDEIIGAKGRQRLKATFQALDGDNVILQTKDGSTQRFPLASLSADDQQVVRTLALSAPKASMKTSSGGAYQGPSNGGGAYQQKFRRVPNPYPHVSPDGRYLPDQTFPWILVPVP